MRTSLDDKLYIMIHILDKLLKIYEWYNRINELWLKANSYFARSRILMTMENSKSNCFWFCQQKVCVYSINYFGIIFASLCCGKSDGAKRQREGRVKRQRDRIASSKKKISTLSRFAPPLPEAKRREENAKVYNADELALNYTVYWH